MKQGRFAMKMAASRSLNHRQVSWEDGTLEEMICRVTGYPVLRAKSLAAFPIKCR
jgi:hypothetical protein